MSTHSYGYYQKIASDFVKDKKKITLAQTLTAIAQEIKNLNDGCLVTRRLGEPRLSQTKLREKRLIEKRKEYDYFMRFESTHGAIESVVKERTELKKQINLKEQAIREKYFMMMNQEILEQTREDMKYVSELDLQEKKLLIDESSCMHCDADGLDFRDQCCPMCGRWTVYGR